MTPFSLADFSWQEYLQARPRCAGYIFDLDGTLVDSMKLHLESWNAAIHKHGGTFQFDCVTFMQVAGVGGEHTVEYLNRTYGLALDPQAVAGDKEIIYLAKLDQLQPIPAVMAVAETACAAGFPCAVASGGPRDTVHRALEVVRRKELFRAIVTQSDVRHSKPAPDLFLLAARLLEVPPSDCLVFEDSPLGLEAAHRAGMRSVQVPNLLS